MIVPGLSVVQTSLAVVVLVVLSDSDSPAAAAAVLDVHCRLSPASNGLEVVMLVTVTVLPPLPRCWTSTVCVPWPLRPLKSIFGL